jgi:uncharacterized protein
MALNIPRVLHAVLEEYRLPLHGHYGVTHWARVLENGLRLAQETKAHCEVVSRRVNEGTDPEHSRDHSAIRAITSWICSLIF